jgi:hypothetical protein
MTAAVQPIRDRMHAARVRDVGQAVKQRTITADEAAQLKAAAAAVAAAVAVDDFAPEELTSRGAFHKGDQPSQAIFQQTPPTTSELPPVELPAPEEVPALPPPGTASEAAE